MIELPINNSVHASTAHTPFFMNGLRHTLIPTQLEGSSYLRGGTRTSKENSNSCSSRVVTNDDACEINVEKFDIEWKKTTNSDDNIVEELDISEKTLTEEKNSLLAVH